MGIEKVNVEIGIIDKFSTAFKSIEKSLGEGIKSISLSNIGYAAAIGTVAYALKQSIDVAADAEVKMTQFDNIIKNTIGSNKFARDQLLKNAKATQQLGFDNEDASISLAKFYQRTQDVTTAIKLNNLAMDFARAKRISLSEASDAMDKVLSGSNKKLLRYGIQFKENQTSMEGLIDLQKKVKDSAEDYAKTYSGNLDRLNLAIEDLQKTIGKILLPTLTDLIDEYLIPAVEAFNDVAGAIQWVINHLKKLADYMPFYTFAVETQKIAANDLKDAYDKGTISLELYNDLMEGVTGETNKASRAQLDGTERYKGLSKGIEDANDALKEQKKIIEETQKKQEELGRNTVDLAKNYNSLQAKLKGILGNIKKDHDDNLNSIKLKIAQVKEEMSALTDSYNEAQIQDKKSIGEAVVSQDKYIAELEKQIKEETDTVKAEILKNELAREISAREKLSKDLLAFDSEIKSAREYAAMTELEQAFFDYNTKKTLADQEYQDKLSGFSQDIIDLNEQKIKEDEILKLATEKIKKLQQESRDHYKQIMIDKTNITKENVEAMSGYYKNLEDKANAAVKAMENAKADMLFQQEMNKFTQQSQGSSNTTTSNITINITGTISSKSIAEEYGDAIVKKLQLSTKTV